MNAGGLSQGDDLYLFPPDQRVTAASEVIFGSGSANEERRTSFEPWSRIAW